MNDAEFVRVIASAIESGRIVFTSGRNSGHARPIESVHKASNAAARLAGAIMGPRGEFAFEGRRYRLVDEVGLRRQTGGDEYRLVSQDDVPALIKPMAEQIPNTPATRSRWGEVVPMVLGPPNGRGLRLLRYVPPKGSKTAASDGPAITPSQLRSSVADTHWIEIEVVYEDGTPFEGNCAIELPGGRVTQGPPGEGGNIRIEGLQAGDCKLRFPGLDAAIFDSA